LYARPHYKPQEGRKSKRHTKPLTGWERWKQKENAEPGGGKVRREKRRLIDDRLILI
jgi:hypothetical protein